MTKGIFILIIAVLIWSAIVVESGLITGTVIAFLILYVGFNERRREITRKALKQIQIYFKIKTNNNE